MKLSNTQLVLIVVVAVVILFLCRTKCVRSEYSLGSDDCDPFLTACQGKCPGGCSKTSTCVRLSDGSCACGLPQPPPATGGMCKCDTILQRTEALGSCIRESQNAGVSWCSDLCKTKYS